VKFSLSKKHISLAPIIIAATLIFIGIVHYGVNTPFWDEWEMVPLFQHYDHHMLSIGDLWRQHNEHRIFFPNAVLLIMAYVTHWNIGAEIVLSFILSLISVSLIYKMMTVRIKNSVLAILGTFFLGFWFYSPVQWENWSWGWQIEWFLCIAAILTSIYLLDRLGPAKRMGTREKTRFIGAIFAAVIASFSLGSGIIVWVVGIITIILYRQRRRIIAYWVSAGVLTTGLYYYHYHKPGGPSVLTFIHQPVGFCKYVLEFFGRPVSDNIDVSRILGAILISLLIPIAGILWFNRRNLNKFIPWLALISLPIMVSLMTAVSRLGFGVEQGMASRYTAFSLLYIIGVSGIFLLAIDTGRISKQKTVLTILISIAVVLPLLISSYKNGINGWRVRSAYMRVVESCTHQDHPSNQCLSMTYPDPNIARERLTYVKQKHWAGY